MKGLESVKGILKSEILRVKADFAAMSGFFVAFYSNMTGR